MELTKEQIELVEHYLDVKHITYVDLRMEVLDHIVSDIETEMSKEKITFNTAFTIAKQKWNKQLKETTSMFFGLGFSAPKIVIQKAKKIYWKQYVFLLASYFLPFLVLTHFDIKIESPAEFNYFIFLKGIVVLSFLAFIFMLLTRNYKIETTYGFILKSQSLSAFTGLIVLAIFLRDLKELNGINIGMLCCYVYTTISYFHFFKKHQKVTNKYKIF